ncbi:MAG: hypothetical protein M1820_001502 [Bogoriella megaspora]|nr:MAG: hypothetical protein M1820_001502 [Bogoriella megaspora]
MEADGQESRSVKAMTASIYFLKRSPLFQTEKPYAFRFPVEDVAQTNMEMERVDSINISDIRARGKPASLEDDGFAILELEGTVLESGSLNQKNLRSYFQTLESLLKSYLRAAEVKIFRHGIRKRHPQFPTSTGEAYEFDQPTSVAHIDTTPEEMNQEIRRQFGSEADHYLSKRSQWINVWKPLKGPLNDWPLTLCDASNVQTGDVESADLLYPDLATENYQVYHNQNYRWYYLSDHKVSEIIVFKQADSEPSRCPGQSSPMVVAVGEL